MCFYTVGFQVYALHALLVMKRVNSPHVQSHAPGHMLKIPSTSSHTLVWTHGHLSLHTLIGIVSTALAAAVAVTLVLTKFPEGNKVKDNKPEGKKTCFACPCTALFEPKLFEPAYFSFQNLHVSLFTQWKQKALVMDQGDNSLVKTQTETECQNYPSSSTTLLSQCSV